MPDVIVDYHCGGHCKVLYNCNGKHVKGLGAMFGSQSDLSGHGSLNKRSADGLVAGYAGKSVCCMLGCMSAYVAGWSAEYWYVWVTVLLCV